MTSKSMSGVVEMPEDQQTLMDASIVQENGTTVLTFTKYLQEEGELEILANGENIFLFAEASVEANSN